MAFGHWIIGQTARTDWIGALAAQAARDPRFPRGGTTDVVRGHLEKAGADGDALAALDDAEREWGRA